MESIPCCLCGCKLETRTSKRGKPYFVCDACGIQLFVRKKQGIERLQRFFANAHEAELPYKQHAQNFHEMQAILKEIDDVDGEIKKLGMSYYFSDDKLRIRNSLKTRRETLFAQLEEFAQRKETAVQENSERITGEVNGITN